jgi:WD40 repeat protein
MQKGLFISIAAAMITVLAACAIQKETPQTISTVSQFTATPEAAATSTVVSPTSTSTPESFETLDAFQIAAAKFSSQCEQISEGFSTISPSGNWLATNCEGLEIINLNGKRITVNFPVQVDWLPTDEEELIYPEYMPIHWSENENYLYFSYILWDGPCGGDSGDCSYMLRSTNYNGLKRINLTTGEISTILNSSIRDFVFSPDGRKLAYISDTKNIIILDLITGKNITIFSDGYGSTDLVWSPDSVGIAFATCYAPLNNDWEIDHSTISIYTQNRISTVLSKPAMQLSVIAWNENNELVTSGMNFKDYTEINQIIPLTEENSDDVSKTATPITK